MREVARRGLLLLLLQSRARLANTASAAERFGEILEDNGRRYHPYQMGILPQRVRRRDRRVAPRGGEEGVYYFFNNCLKGHLRRQGRCYDLRPGGA